MNLGFPLTTPEDLTVLRNQVISARAKANRPLRGIEIGPWLGRATLALLAPDLPLSAPLSGDEILWQLRQEEYADYGKVVEKAETLFSRLQGDVIGVLKQHLVRHLCLSIRRRGAYFSMLYVIDTWRGIDSETQLFFRDRQPKTEFLRNMALAGFADVVTPLEGDSSILLTQPLEPVDFVFIDGAHEHMDVVRDLFAIRNAITPATVVCGHDIAHLERWPGVRCAVDRFIKHYQVGANVWIASPEGVAHLLSQPPYEHFAQEVESTDRQQRARYNDPVLRARWGLKP